MSRLIVKNLPKNIKKEKLHSIFASKGEITDLKLCKSKDGVFRKFGFVGFKTEEQAERAMKFFSNSYIDTSKIQIDIARNLGEKSSSRPWSKYSEGSSAYHKRISKMPRKHSKCSENDGKIDSETEKRKCENAKTKDKEKDLDVKEEDREFQEFLNAHQNRITKSLWSNDSYGNTSVANRGEQKQAERRKSTKTRETLVILSKDDDNNNSSDQNESDQGEYNETKSSTTNLSDMDYLKTKIKTKPDDDDLNSASGDDDNVSSSNEDKSSNEKDSSKEKSNKGKCISPKPKYEEKQNSQNTLTLKMRGLPFKLSKKEIMDFFSPIECLEIRFVNNKKGQPSGRAFVDFKSEADLKEALKRDRDYLKRRYIELFRDEKNDTPHDLGQKEEEEGEKPWVKKLKEEGEDDEEDETIGESGRLFLRNLSYTCTEGEIQNLFEKHGPVTEVNLPLDKQTNKTIGIGYVTFLMPEHAVKAFNELDGKVFQGRLLHILPSKARKPEISLVDTTYKKKNEAKKKYQSSSSHNWNTLFLGVSAVAEAMADKYNTTKRGILDAESSSSLAVRMALGETQVVADTRKFLVDHGVKLDVFGQPTSNRSKTVILAKNLPFGTKAEELETLFSSFGPIGRIVIPPSGISALVGFTEPSIARKAFQKLAYTKFKNSLLYLEWAPVDVFVENFENTKTNEEEIKEEKEKKERPSDEESGSEDSEGKTLFVKNLNFETTEEALKETFSQAGDIKSVTIARKKDSKNRGALLSMGYGFIEFKKKSSALKAMKELQHFMLDKHALELKISHRKSSANVTKKKNITGKQKNSKILVRNVPFEATSKELRELFSTFGEIKILRLPKKVTGTGPHRGFAFVDFLTKQDAKRAFESLSTSTHLYGRRLVLEWAEDEDDVQTLRKRTAEHFLGKPKKSKKKQAFLDELAEIDNET